MCYGATGGPTGGYKEKNRKTGSNDVNHVIWAISKFFFLLLITLLFKYTYVRFV